MLVANLRHADYVQALCGTIERLPAALATLEMQSAIVPALPCESNATKTGLRKVEAARAVGERVEPRRSRSHSFIRFREALTEATT